MTGRSAIERGTLAGVPCAGVGSGSPVLVVLAGLSPRVGVERDRFVRSVLAPVRALAVGRRLVVLNRWPGLPDGLTMSGLADRYARAIDELGAPADVLGVSTGGSIAQQLAAEHPRVVRRLALVSTGWRLSPGTRALQAEVARLLREGATRDAAATMAGSAGPRALAPLLRAAGRLVAPRLLGDERSMSDLRVTLEAEDAFDLARCSGRIEAPTLVVGGGRDRFYPLSSFEETARLIPGSRLVIRPRRGHVTVCGDRATAAYLAGFFAAA